MWIKIGVDFEPLTDKEESDLLAHMTKRYEELLKDERTQINASDLDNIVRWYEHLSYYGGDKLSDDKISEFISYDRADFITLLKETLECMRGE